MVQFQVIPHLSQLPFPLNNTVTLTSFITYAHTPKNQNFNNSAASTSSPNCSLVIQAPVFVFTPTASNLEMRPFSASPESPHASGSTTISARFYLSQGFLLHYSYSFRIGTATTASRQGISKHTIKVPGRWSSHAYDSYIQSHLSDGIESHCLAKSCEC